MLLIHLVLLELEYDCVQSSGKLALPPVAPDRKKGVTADRCIFSYRVLYSHLSLMTDHELMTTEF